MHAECLQSIMANAGNDASIVQMLEEKVAEEKTSLNRMKLQKSEGWGARSRSFVSTARNTSLHARSNSFP